MNALKKIINNRTCFILAHGKSIEKLEEKIVDLKKYNICYVSLSLFNVIEEFILSKINKHLDIVFDSATVSDSFLVNYEKVRLNRLSKFLERKENNLWITTFGIERDSIRGLNNNWFLEKHQNKMFIVDYIFPSSLRGNLMSVPNSVCLLIASLLYGGAKKIILFGFDGCLKQENNLDTYYKPEYHKEEHLLATGKEGNTGLYRDTLNFQQVFPILLHQYRNLFKNNAEILNCSPNSAYTVIKKISYEELEKCLI